MKRDQIIATFMDELCGLLLASFVESSRTTFTQHACSGAMMREQMRRGKDLIGRIVDAAQPKPKEEVLTERNGHVNGVVKAKT